MLFRKVELHQIAILNLVKIAYTKHAEGKFKSFSMIGWAFTRKQIKEALTKPDGSGVDTERSAKFVLKKIDTRHDLRVIYSDTGGIITVITFYPTRRKRYG